MTLLSPGVLLTREGALSESKSLGHDVSPVIESIPLHVSQIAAVTSPPSESPRFSGSSEFQSLGSEANNESSEECAPCQLQPEQPIIDGLPLKPDETATFFGCPLPHLLETTGKERDLREFLSINLKFNEKLSPPARNRATSMLKWNSKC
ncbi:hypothetical protein T459_03553 [Capsicum annuum]|uniref:Uncharacterized protein n=1 Tax=Capsicum annuum TaxID=4072 RepID=A0A2G3AN61_CAPAN|nr:hypothetical protein T459_03553 [Capsicum annuum]